MAGLVDGANTGMERRGLPSRETPSRAFGNGPQNPPMRRASSAFSPPGLDVYVANSQILDVPVELSLKFMTVVCPNGMDPERKLSDYVVDESDSIRLGMSLVNL